MTCCYTEDEIRFFLLHSNCEGDINTLLDHQVEDEQARILVEEWCNLHDTEVKQNRSFSNRLVDSGGRGLVPPNNLL